jgi:hypothetical protein
MTDKWEREARRLVEDKTLLIFDAYPELAAQYYQYVRDLGKEEQAVDEPVGDEKLLIVGLVEAVAETLRKLDGVQAELREERAARAEERVEQARRVKLAWILGAIWSVVTFVLGIVLEPVLSPFLTGLVG